MLRFLFPLVLVSFTLHAEVETKEFLASEIRQVSVKNGADTITITATDAKNAKISANKKQPKYKPTPKNHYEFFKLFNCMPIHELVKLLKKVPPTINNVVKQMMYNSILIVIINVKKDTIGEHFALMVPQKDVIFHRISKLDFLGDSYHLKDSTSFMLEVTYRKGDRYDQMSKQQLVDRCIEDLVKIGFIDNKDTVNFTDFHQEKYAYVIYDLNHRQNTDEVLNYLRSIGIESSGRWAEFEYMNSDKVIEHSMNLADQTNARA